ncbi:hypothetical protein ACFRFU_31045 [Streptomyces sp. NPDC056704]|uniref:hypothetical protein n=1 Tax=Streptomyces sp. NPDC056704 TaxID=3345917 RepID=UPI0036AD1793
MELLRPCVLEVTTKERLRVEATTRLCEQGYPPRRPPRLLEAQMVSCVTGIDSPDRMDAVVQ